MVRIPIEPLAMAGSPEGRYRAKRLLMIGLPRYNNSWVCDDFRLLDSLPSAGRD